MATWVERAHGHRLSMRPHVGARFSGWLRSLRDDSPNHAFKAMDREKARQMRREGDHPVAF